MSGNKPDLIEPKPLVSILIPAWNESARLTACLDSILTLRYPNKELILCAGGEDGTFDLAERYIRPTVLVLKQELGEGKQKALQRCFERSRGEVIFLTDADCIWDDEAFEATLEAIIAEKEMVATGSWKPLPEQAGNALVQFQCWQHILREVTFPAYVNVLDGRNTAVRRKALEKAEGFLSIAPIGTDFVLSKSLVQVGYKICFIRNSRVQTEYPTSVSAYTRQRSRWQRNCLLYGFRYRDWVRVKEQFRMIFTAIIMLALPVFSIVNRYCCCIWLFTLGYLYLAQVRLYWRVKKWRPELLLRPPPVYLFLYLVVDWLASARGLIEALCPLQRWKW